MTTERGAGPGVDLADINEPLRGSKSIDWSIAYLCDTILAEGQIDLDPDYQRGRVWTEQQQRAFVGHVLEGGSMPDLWMRVLKEGEATGQPPFYECVDGKQRVLAMLAWWEGRIPAQLSKENGSREIWAEDLSRSELTRLRLDIMPRVQLLEGYSRKQILRVYLRLNRGIPHTEAELERVQALYEAEP